MHAPITDEGPRAELEAWKLRAQWLGRLGQQLKRPDCRAVLVLGAAARLAAHKAWRDAEAKVPLVSSASSCLSLGCVHCSLRKIVVT